MSDHPDISSTLYSIVLVYFLLWKKNLEGELHEKSKRDRS